MGMPVSTSTPIISSTTSADGEIGVWMIEQVLIPIRNHRTQRRRDRHWRLGGSIGRVSHIPIAAITSIATDMTMPTAPTRSTILASASAISPTGTAPGACDPAFPGPYQAAQRNHGSP
jgi:hypothetical protein